MTTVTEERQLRVYCPTHRINFEVPESGRILCESGGHALALNFPHEGFWEYCCDCQVFWPSEIDKGGKAKESCPVCTRTTARRYLCHECKVVSIESDDPARRKSFRVGTRGRIEPACPGCGKESKPNPAEHVCEEAAASFTTALAKCPFCDDPVKKPEPAEPAEKIFCGKCGTQAAKGHDFCKKCGNAVGRKAAELRAAREADAVAPGPASPYTYAGSAATESAYTPPEHVPHDDPIGVTTHTPVTQSLPPKKYGGAIAAVGLVGFLIVLFLIIASYSGGGSNTSNSTNTLTGSRFKENLDRALAANQLFYPSGSCVADLYDAEAARSPNSSALAEAASKIRTKLDPIGEDAFSRYYAESDDTIDWNNISKVYELLKKVSPDNQEYRARYAYSLGLVNMKSMSFATAVSNFQESLTYHPNWAMAYNGLGRVYLKEEWTAGRDESKTVEYYRKACDLDTNFTWGCRNLGAYYMKNGDWTDAETYMTKALQRSPSRDTIWKAMKTICQKVGKYQDSSTGQCVG
jgi:hypothetical protein